MNAKQTNHRIPTVAMLLIATAALAAPHAGAHNGYDCLTVLSSVLEGECYTATTNTSCEPDYDGEHTYISFEGSRISAVLPHSGCSIAYKLEGDVLHVSSVDIMFSGAPVTFVSTITITSPGGTASCSASALAGTWATAPCSGLILPGPVVLSYSITSGPGYGNLFVDKLHFS